MTPVVQKLVLGTAQLGMPYGLANRTGQPSRQEASLVLDVAWGGGIRFFDTASAYGSAEELIGEWIEGHEVTGEVRIVSKGTAKTVDEMETEIRGSLKRLHIDRLDGYLLHSKENMFANERLEALRQVKGTGLATHVGVSVYEENEALSALEADLDYIQVPYNAFDQRLERADFFDRAEASGATIFARSPFLQGLLLMVPEALPPHLAVARPHLEQFIEMSQRHNLSPLEAALLFACSSRAQHIIFGAESQVQVGEVLAIVKNKAMPVDLLEEIRESFQNLDSSIVDPRVWKKQS